MDSLDSLEKWSVPVRMVRRRHPQRESSLDGADTGRKTDALIEGRRDMQRTRAEDDLELIRTMMERANRYEHLSARAGLKVGLVAILGALSFCWLDATRPVTFGSVWGVVFLTSVAVTVHEQVREVRALRLPVWTGPARRLVQALLPACAVASILTCQAFVHGRHLELPGIWMLCYGCGVLSTMTYAPPVVLPIGVGFLVLGALTLFLGPGWAVFMMALTFGVGHLALGLRLALLERQTGRPVNLKVV